MNPLQLLQLANAFNPASGIKEKYNFQDPGNIDENIKKIGDLIVQNIASEYINKAGQIDDVQIEGRIKTDLRKIYYEDPGIKKVKANIKEKICNAWYSALKGRNERIMKDLITLMQHRKEIEQQGNDQQRSKIVGGTNTPLLSLPSLTSLPSLSEIKSDIMNSMSASASSDDLTLASENAATVNPVPDPAQNAQDKRNTAYFESYIAYKTKLFAIENYKNKPMTKSATVSQVYDLHENIVSKILCNYAVIDRPELMKHLQNLILSEKAISQLDHYKKKTQWFPSKTEESTETLSTESIYTSFIKKIEALGNTSNNTPSKLTTAFNKKVPKIPVVERDVIQIPVVQKLETIPIPVLQIGGEQEQPKQKIPEYIPSTHIWDKIKVYVESQTRMLIEHNLNLNTEPIKRSFKEVFLQVNCDCLNIVDEKNEQMTDFFNREYHSILETLCKNIPDEEASLILQSYIVRNYPAFVDLLSSVFEKEGNVADTFLFDYSSFASEILEHEDIKLVPPEIDRQSKSGPNDSDPPCNVRNGDKNLSNDEVPDFLAIEGIGKERSIADKVTPAILLSVFNVYKDQFEQCTRDEPFLRELFDMYSSRCIKFMKQIRLQFENDGVNDYIEMYILTKHPYTSKIISESAKHAADIKASIAKKPALTEEEEENPEKIKEQKGTQDNFVRLISQYAAFLMHTGSIVKPDIDTTVQNPFIVFIESQVPLFSNLVSPGLAKEINTEIIERISPQEQAAYNNGLQKIFPVKKPVITSSRKFTQKKR